MIVTIDDYTGPTELVHLHNHTIFSALDGVASPLQYAMECSKRGYPAMAVTEHGNVASVPDFYISFKDHKVKPIFGCEIYYNDHHQAYISRQQDITAQKCNASDNPAVWADYMRFLRSRHLTVLAKNEVGFSNLLKLTTDVHQYGYHGQRGRSRAWFDLLCKYREGLIILSGCLNGPIAYELKRRHPVRIQESYAGKDRFRIRESGDLLPYAQRMANAVKEAKRFKAVFGDDYFIELQMPLIYDSSPSPFELDIMPDGNDEFKPLVDLQVFRDLIIIAEDLDIKFTFANDVHYMKRDDHDLQRVMMAISQDVPLDSPDLFASNSSEQYMKTRADLWCTFKNHSYSIGIPDSVFELACDNTLLVADNCKEIKIDRSPKIPSFGDADYALRNQVYEALAQRGFDKSDSKFVIDGKEVTYQKQADIELDRFIEKGFSSYFLITADLVRFGKSKGWPFSPRGSAGGSLVCFLLGISTINPLPWGLSFDRFLSPSRGGFMLKVKMPEPVL